jgi:hypothetical protein
MTECLNCGELYPPTACRWRCPSCGYKDSCCDGSPQRVSGRNAGNRANGFKGVLRFDSQVFE